MEEVKGRGRKWKEEGREIQILRTGGEGNRGK
jgi:hypothetical protein